MTSAKAGRPLRTLLRRPAAIARLRRLDRLERKARARIVWGNRVTVHEEGERAYAAMTEALTAARRAIAIEMYTWADDRAGRTFADVAAARARAGLPVRVVLDAFGSMRSVGIASRLADAGVQVLWYHPLVPWTSRWLPNRRDHRKMIIVDGSVGFVGGMNLAEDYTRQYAGERAWRDLTVKVEGPAVREMVRGFVGAWVRAGGDLDAAGDLAANPGEVGRAAVQVVMRLGLIGRRALRRTHLEMIRGARRRVFIANAYFAPERVLKRALVGAARRGVRVDLLLPQETDVPLVRWAARASYGALLDAGVAIREHRGSILHAKAAVFDSRVLLTGSANLDYRSFRHNLEVAVNILDETAAEAALRGFERDWENAFEVEPEAWRRRGFGDRAREGFARLFRYWL